MQVAYRKLHGSNCAVAQLQASTLILEKMTKNQQIANKVEHISGLLLILQWLSEFDPDEDFVKVDDESIALLLDWSRNVSASFAFKCDAQSKALTESVRRGCSPHRRRTQTMAGVRSRQASYKLLQRNRKPFPNIGSNMRLFWTRWCKHSGVKCLTPSD